MKIALAQTNSTVGDLCGNAKRILAFSGARQNAGANVVVFPELSLTGYPPRDLLEKESFLDRTEQHLERLAADAAPLGRQHHLRHCDAHGLVHRPADLQQRRGAARRAHRVPAA